MGAQMITWAKLKAGFKTVPQTRPKAWFKALLEKVTLGCDQCVSSAL